MQWAEIRESSTLKSPCGQTKRSSSLGWFVQRGYQGRTVLTRQQEREIEKVNVFYLQKEAEARTRVLLPFFTTNFRPVLVTLEDTTGQKAYDSGS
jgi:hypothetical protein